jgi:hypothetical protein
MVIGTLVVLASDASQDKNMSVLGSWDIFHTRQALLLGISSICFLIKWMKADDTIFLLL